MYLLLPSASSLGRFTARLTASSVGVNLPKSLSRGRSWDASVGRSELTTIPIDFLKAPSPRHGPLRKDPLLLFVTFRRCTPAALRSQWLAIDEPLSRRILVQCRELRCERDATAHLWVGVSYSSTSYFSSVISCYVYR